MSLNFILADAAPKTVSIGPGAPAQAGNAAVSNAVKATETVAVDPAAAAGQEQPPQQVPFFANPIILMLVVLGVMFFFTFRSQKKQQQKRQQMLDAIQAQEDRTQEKLKEKAGAVVRLKKNW